LIDAGLKMKPKALLYEIAKTHQGFTDYKREKRRKYFETLYSLDKAFGSVTGMKETMEMIEKDIYI
jgi:hypothetical protein